MLVSLNELDSTTRKAFRGEGYHWGEAEEAGKAAVWLAARGLDPLTAILDLLRKVKTTGLVNVRPQRQSGQWLSSSAAMCPVCAGLAVADDPAGNILVAPRRLRNVMSPLLLLPFLAAASTALQRPIAASCESFTAILTGGTVVIDGQVETPLAASVIISAPQPARWKSGCPAAVKSPSVDPHQWDALCRFAAATYVPATEHSRNTGAGAGTTDDNEL